jgi:hypothetical protein
MSDKQKFQARTVDGETETVEIDMKKKAAEGCVTAVVSKLIKLAIPSVGWFFTAGLYHTGFWSVSFWWAALAWPYYLGEYIANHMR